MRYLLIGDHEFAHPDAGCIPVRPAAPLPDSDGLSGASIEPPSVGVRAV